MNEAEPVNGFARGAITERSLSRARAALARGGNALRLLWAEIRTPVLIYLATRGALYLVIYLSLAILPVTPGFWQEFPDNKFLDGWTRWDGGWYTNIAEHGYSTEELGPPGQKNVAFFPLYPLAVRFLNLLLGNVYLSGIVVSNLAFIIAAILLFRMTCASYGADIAVRTVLLWSVFPFSFYSTAIYSDALFCLFVVAAFYMGERRRWWAAGLCALLAGSTRATGIVLLPVLAIMYLSQIQFNLRKLRPDVLWIGLAGLGPVLYFVYLYLRFGDPLLYLAAMQAEPWSPDSRGLSFVVDMLQQMLVPGSFLTASYPVAFAFNLGITILLIVTLVWIFRKQGLAPGILSLLLIAVSLSQWVGMGRYALAVFPAFVAWAQMLKNRLAFESVLVLCALLLALWAIAFSHWVWVT